MLEGRSLVMAVLPCDQWQTLLQGLHDQIEGSSRRKRAVVLSARDPFTGLNLLQVSVVAGHQTTFLHGFWALVCLTCVSSIQVAAVMNHLQAGETATFYQPVHACITCVQDPACSHAAVATCSQVPAVSGS